MKNYDGKSVTVLLVEDNIGDARLAIEALKDGKIKNEMYHVKDGVEAMEYLSHEGKFNASNAPRPDVILLDLNMPRMDGREVLQKIKDDLRLSVIPVIILTTSQSEIDIAKSYLLKANCYIAKPVDFEQFTKVVRDIEHFWFTIVTLPDTGQK